MTRIQHGAMPAQLDFSDAEAGLHRVHLACVPARANIEQALRGLRLFLREKSLQASQDERKQLLNQ